MCFNTLMFQSSMQEIDFTSEVLDPRATLSRASGGTRFNSAGTLETIGSNLPRFDYDPSTLAFRGVLVEEQRTNYITRTESLDNGAWLKLGTGAPSVTANAAAGPDGLTTAEKLVEFNGSTNGFVAHYGSPTVLCPINSWAKVCASFFLKDAGAGYAFLRGHNNSPNVFYSGIIVNLSTGAISTPVSPLLPKVEESYVKALPSSWYRVGITSTPNATATPQGGPSIWPARSTAFSNTQGVGPATHTGDGVTGVYAIGVVYEVGAFPTSYIPSTGGSATTRYADDLTVSSLASIRFNPAGGTLYVSGTAPPYLAQAAVLASFNDNSSNAVIRLRMDTSGVLRAEVIDGGVTQASLALGTLTAGQAFKAVMSYSANDVRGKLQGGTAQADTSATIPTVDRLMIGRGASGEYWNSGIKRLRIFPGPLADAEQASLVA